ncbi:hypothetical protein Poly51_08070 [Rubripirellula tenax]|uniref:Uncharacterized protein n=1 Tax=Rubripirellula tenax TaxID=2528015 RepID=A0A5C6FG69_9BACT|nr:hypothetical protein Poly51_08070 [Rubripirellula tenax]
MRFVPSDWESRRIANADDRRMSPFSDPDHPRVYGVLFMNCFAVHVPRTESRVVRCFARVKLGLFQHRADVLGDLIGVLIGVDDGRLLAGMRQLFQESLPN